MLAFDTVVSVSARIRSNPADLISRFALSATGTRLRQASTNTIDYYNSHQFPISGVKVNGSGTLGYTNYQIIVGDDASFSGHNFYDGTTFSFYAKSDNSAGGTVFGFVGSGANQLYGSIQVRLSDNSLQFAKPYGGGYFTWAVPDIRELHHYYIHIGAWNWPKANTADRIVVVDVWVDGIQISQQSYYTGDPTNPFYTIPDTFTLGNFNGADAFYGTIAQLWVGYNSPFGGLKDYTPNTYETFGTYGSGGAAGVTPSYYAEYANSTGDLNTINVFKISYPLQGNFTFTAQGDNTVFAQSFSTARFSLSATCVRTKPATFTTAARFTATVNPYNFTKAQTALISRFTATVNAYDFTKAQTALTSRTAVSATCGFLRNKTATLLSRASMAVTAIKQNSGQTTASSAFNMQATSRISTLINADITARFTLEAEGRLQARVRATADLSAKLTLSVTPKVTRRVQSAVTTRASLVAQCVVIRAGQIQMSALAFQLSAGRIIEFLRENTILVAQEQRLLLTALESTVLLVQMSNGVNTITAEPRSTLVPQEQGVLLAQFNMPTN